MFKPMQSLKMYLMVYLGLMLLLILTVGASFIDIGGSYNTGIAIGIACIKGILIVLFFMHMKWEPWVTWFFALAGFLWLGILLTLSTSEYLTRNHPPGMSPKGEPVFLNSEGPRTDIPYQRRTNISDAP